MQSLKHRQHIEQRVSWGGHACLECSADTERRFNPRAPWRYDHVPFYLAFARAGLAGKGVRLERFGDVLDSKRFAREFLIALHRRIYLKGNPLAGRKTTDGFTERILQFRSRQDGRYFAKSGYLRAFSERKGY